MENTNYKMLENIENSYSTTLQNMTEQEFVNFYDDYSTQLKNAHVLPKDTFYKYMRRIEAYAKLKGYDLEFAEWYNVPFKRYMKEVNQRRMKPIDELLNIDVEPADRKHLDQLMIMLLYDGIREWGDLLRIKKEDWNGGDQIVYNGEVYPLSPLTVDLLKKNQEEDYYYSNNGRMIRFFRYKGSLIKFPSSCLSQEDVDSQVFENKLKHLKTPLNKSGFKVKLTELFALKVSDVLKKELPIHVLKNMNYADIEFWMSETDKIPYVKDKRRVASLVESLLP